MDTISAAFDGPRAVDHSEIVGVNANPLFSRDHFQYMLCHVFSEARKGWQVDDRDRPILWRTKADDRGRYTGECLLFHFQPNRIYPALPEAVGAGASATAVHRQNFTNCVYNDNFFQTIHGAFKDCPFAFVMIGRMYLHLVCQALNAGKGAETVRLGHIERFASEYVIGDSLFCHFWQQTINMHDYIVRTAKEIDLLDCVGILSPSLEPNDKYSNCWKAILNGVNIDLLKLRLDTTSGKNNPIPCENQMLGYDVIWLADTPEAVNFDSNLVQHTLGRAILLQAESLVITDFYLSTLMGFRKAWVIKRNDIQTAKDNRELPDVDTELLNQFKGLVIFNGFRMIGLKPNKRYRPPAEVTVT
jgi:hypothetical protein